ncbi:MAG: hypothetical protein U1E73_02050 [Planctomycetota bacterium]
MKAKQLAILVAAALSSACSFIGATAQLGYTMARVQGDVATTPGKGGVLPNSEQHLEPALGLGDDVGSPYLRGQADLGSLVLTGSLFALDEHGSGTLQGTFGSLASGTNVDSSLHLTNAKLSATVDIGLGPVKVSPGLAVDLVDFRLVATEPTFGNSAAIDRFLPLPMLFCRAEGDIGIVTAVVEAGYLDIPEVGGTGVRLLDLEALLEVRAAAMVHFFAGYRRIDLDGFSETSDSSFALDTVIDGWIVGGGVRF